MAFNQLAKLYLRGSLCTKTMRGLTDEQKEEIDKIVQLVTKDPNLQQCRIEFCNALGRTIKNEYHDPKVGEQDFQIAASRAAIAAIYGYSKKPPHPLAITDSTQRKKWFQTWVFQYLRQILKENKIPTDNHSQLVKLPAEEIAKREVLTILSESLKKIVDYRTKHNLRCAIKNAKIEEKWGKITIGLNLMAFPNEINQQLISLSKTYLKYGVKISWDNNGVYITEPTTPVMINIKVKSSTIMKSQSFDQEDSDGHEQQRDRLEMLACQHRRDDDMDSRDTFEQLQKRVPKEAKPILELYNEETRPHDFIDRYGVGHPKTSEIAEFFQKSPREIKRIISVIRIHCMIINLGY